MPVGTHSAPVSLIVPIQNTQTVEMMADSAILSPSPLRATMEAVVIMVSSPQVPVASDIVTASPVPSAEGSQSVKMSANSTELAPEPLGSLVVVIPSVQIPVSSHTAPPALVVAVEHAQPVEMMANSAVTAPAPLSPAMMAVIVMVAFD